MGKISNEEIYIQDTDISDLDSLIGTDGNTTARTTKNFLMGKLKSYFKSGLSPLTGGTLRFTEISYTGELYANAHSLVNALDPFFTIDQYHIVVVSLNGVKSILKLQNREVGLDKTPVIAGDFIQLTSTIDAVLATGNTTNESILFINGTATADINAFQVSFTDASNNSYRIQSNGVIAYDSAQNSTFLKLPVKPLQNAIFQTPLKNTGTYTVALSTDLPTVESSSLSVTQEGSVITVELPVVSDIPSLIVNDLYIPTYADFLLGKTKGNGTASKPFTNTITYTSPTTYTTSPNTAIQNALDAYKGTGGKGTIADSANPQLWGSVIQVEKGSGTYNFTGNIDYLDAKIQLKSGAVVGSTPVGYWLMDFSAFSTTTTHNPIITIEEGAYLFCHKSGFKLVGGDFALSTENRKSLRINGNSTGTGISLIGTLESDILFEVNGGSEVYVNGGFHNLIINSFISTRRGRMFVVKGNGSVSCNSSPLYFLTDKTVTITNTYSPIELRDTGKLSINKSEITLNKTATVTYNQLVSTYDTALLDAIDSIFIGDSIYFAYNNTGANTATIRLDACKMYITTTSSFANTVSGVWVNMILTNNNMPNTSIDPATTELIPSSVNTIGGKIIETLSIYESKALAVAAGIGKGGAFIKATNVSAANLVAGFEYKVTTLGDGALGALNTYFTATGSETGTGVGTLYERDIVI